MNRGLLDTCLFIEQLKTCLRFGGGGEMKENVIGSCKRLNAIRVSVMSRRTRESLEFLIISD